MKLINPYLDRDGYRLARLIDKSLLRELDNGVPFFMYLGALNSGHVFLFIKQSLVLKLKNP